MTKAIIEAHKVGRTIVENNVMGTYVHGIFDNAVIIDHLLQGKVQKRTSALTMDEFKNQQYDRLAEHVRQHLNMNQLYQILSDHA